MSEENSEKPSGIHKEPIGQQLLNNIRVSPSEERSEPLSCFSKFLLVRVLHFVGADAGFSSSQRTLSSSQRSSLLTIL
jgi:hypothetical protein